jgi:hypothetical protein
MARIRRFCRDRDQFAAIQIVSAPEINLDHIASQISRGKQRLVWNGFGYFTANSMAIAFEY